jgi:hypothetical protein
VNEIVLQEHVNTNGELDHDRRPRSLSRRPSVPSAAGRRRIVLGTRNPPKPQREAEIPCPITILWPLLLRLVQARWGILNIVARNHAEESAYSATDIGCTLSELRCKYGQALQIYQRRAPHTGAPRTTVGRIRQSPMQRSKMGSPGGACSELRYRQYSTAMRIS